MKTEVESGKVKTVQDASGGCCGGGAGPEAEVRHVIGPLNETIFEFLNEDEKFKESLTTIEGRDYSVDPAKYIEQICDLTRQCNGNKLSKNYSVSLSGSVVGLAEGEGYRQGDLVTFKISVEKLEGLKTSKCD
jgi:hypothetical protein